MLLPKARASEIVVQSLGKETLVYDLKTNQAYNLNETSSLIFNACDGSTTFEQLKKRHKLTDDLIHFALDELQKSNLITGEVSPHFAGMSRREVIRKVGLASMVALPVIASIIAPSATNAASGSAGLPNGSACTTANPSVCASGNCSAALQTCCNRLPGGASDGAPCSSPTDCCLTGSGCRTNGTCCRGAGRGAGTSGGGGNPALCCSGQCVDSGSLCVCT